MSQYDELINALELAWSKAGVRYKNSRKSITVGRQTIRVLAPLELNRVGRAVDRLPDYIASVYKTWFEQWRFNVHRTGTYKQLRAANERLNKAARGLVIGDELLSGRRVGREARQEVFDRNVHGVLEAHHVVEKGWRTHFKRLRDTYPDDDVMPAINLPQADHRGNVSQIAGLVGEKIPPDLMKTSAKSITAVLNSQIVAAGQVPTGATPRLIVNAATTEREFFDALHDVYSTHDKGLYDRVLRGQLLGIEKEIGLIP